MTLLQTAKSRNPYLEGFLAPVGAEVTATDLEVTGRIPEHLHGRYLRNGPNPAAEVDPATYHWFTGDGMVHGVALRDGKACWYRNRWVRSPAVCATLGGFFNLLAGGLVLLDRSFLVLHRRVFRPRHVLDRRRQHNRVTARINHGREMHQNLSPTPYATRALHVRNPSLDVGPRRNQNALVQHKWKRRLRVHRIAFARVLGRDRLL